MTRILVADDNPQFAEMLRVTLEDAGFEVVTAYSGLAAVACVERGDVDVAILDVLMPGVSGDAIAEQMRQMSPGMPVLLMTGAGGQFVGPTRAPVLRKPFAEQDLLAAVRGLAPTQA